MAIVDKTIKPYLTAIHDMIAAWEKLPEGRYSAREIERWLDDHMTPAINRARLTVGYSTRPFRVL